MSKIILGVYTATGEKFAQRRQNCMDTWLSSLRSYPQIQMAWVTGGGADCPWSLDQATRVLKMPCPDDYKSLPQKTRRFAQWCIGNTKFDYLFKCDDDTMVDLHRLVNFEGIRHRSVRYAGQNYNGYASGGAGYFLNPEAARVVQDAMIDAHGDEDLIAGRHLARNGVPLFGDRRFEGFTGANGRVPMADNDMITGHGMSMETWRNSWASLTDFKGMKLWIPTADKYVESCRMVYTALKRQWPAHPEIHATHLDVSPGLGCREFKVGSSSTTWKDAAINYLTCHNTDELVMLMLDDYALFAPVDTRSVAVAMDIMRKDRNIAQFHLTWQPPTPEGDYKGMANVVRFGRWDYEINMQCSIFRRSTLLKLLQSAESKSVWSLEQEMSRLFRNLFPGHITVGWNIPRPHNASGFVDGTDKSGWLTPYHNLMHQGKLDERHAEFARGLK